MPAIRFAPGDPVPMFACRSSNNRSFAFGSVAGRFLVLTFFGSARGPEAARVLRCITGDFRRHFDDRRAAFFGVSTDPDDESLPRVRGQSPGIRFFWDFDGRISRLYGALDETGAYSPFTLVLDPSLRVYRRIPLADAESHNVVLGDLLGCLPPVDYHAEVPVHAPILIVPRVFERPFCRELISIYEREGGRESGSMIERDGYTVGKIDYGFKRRRDCDITDEAVRVAMRARLRRRLVPEVQKAFQFTVTHLERYIVACYEDGSRGFFKPHRDNTTRGTMHRRFACTINLNAEEYEGGDLRFPEFGTRTYRAPTGGAVVFSCSLLHEATPVTRGVRYATLPFLYDSAAARIRNENRKYLSGEVVNLNPVAPAAEAEDDAGRAGRSGA